MTLLRVAMKFCLLTSRLEPLGSAALEVLVVGEAEETLVPEAAAAAEFCSEVERFGAVPELGLVVASSLAFAFSPISC